MAVLAHVVHVGRDVRALNRWYEMVFGVDPFMGWPEPHFLESEQRYASMFMVGDLCIETMAPAEPVDETTAIGRAFARRGAHLFSVACRVENVPRAGRRLLDAGVSIAGPGGARATEIADDVRYIMPSPRDTAGIRVELLDVVITGDPRSAPEWEPRPGPLGLRGLVRVIAEVADPGAAHDALAPALGPVLAAVELVSGDRPGWSGVRFAVGDIDRAERHLRSIGVVAERTGPSELVIAPEHAHGARVALCAASTV
ncbi:MAG: VOC family protein [Acidimicrobiales bacterium]